MERVFLKILEMGMAGSACTVFVLALRMLLRKKPKSFSYVLWAVVFLRLLCPFALQSRYFGLALGNMEQTLETAAYEQELVQYQLLVHKDGSVETTASRNVQGRPATSAGESKTAGFYYDVTGGNFRPQEEAWGADRVSGAYPNQRDFVNRRYSRSAVLRLERGWVTVGSVIWAAGVAVLLGYSLVSYLLLYGRLRQAVRVQEDVYESDRISTPFLLGILDPRIYLPVGLPQEERAYVLAHELVHLKRGDYLVKVATWLALSLHWFNPLVWLAYGLMVRDMEMSCDERVIGRLGEGGKKAYSQALLTISSASGESIKRHLLISTPLSFGENDIRSRVKNILAYRSVKAGTKVVLGLLMAVMSLVLLTDWQTSGEEAQQESVMGVDANEAIGKQQDNNGFNTLEETELPADSRFPAEEMQAAAGTDLSDDAGYDLEDGKAGFLEERLLDPPDHLREMDRGDETTWEQSQTLAEKMNPQTEIDVFRRDIGQLGDWVSGWELPHGELVQVGDYQADLIWGGGVLFTWKEEERDLKDAWAAEEWKGAGSFTQVENRDETEYESAPFIFDDKGKLIDMWLLMNHSDYNAPAEVLEGCQEQAVLVSMNHDLYTISDLDELAEAGRPVPEEEATADFWYIGFAREDAPYGYVLSLAERYFTKEEAIAMARSIRFTETAWAADSTSP